MTDYAKPDSLPFRSYYAQQRRKKRKAANALVQRYITSLSAAGGMYYQLSEPAVVTPDFEIEFKFVTTQDNFNFVSAQNPSDDGVYIDMLDGKVSAFPYIGTTAPGSKLITTVNTYNDGSEQTCVLKVSANSAALTVGSESTAPVFWGLDLNQTISQLGLRGSTYSTGEIYDLKIWTGGDRDTGTLVLDMPIDEDWTKGTVVHNRAADLGVELNANGFADPDEYSYPISGWTVQDGNATCDGSFNALLDVRNLPINNSDVFVVEFTIDAGSTGSVRPAIYGQGLVGLGLSRNASGTYTEIIKLETASSSTTNTIRLQNIGNFIGTVSNFSVRKIPAGYPFATAINVTESEAEKFTLVDGGTAWQSDTRTIPIAQTDPVVN